jgi:hypothetical protein
MIKQEDFDKLKQLDRIEYRQKFEGINKHLEYNLSMNSFVITLIFLFVVDIWFALRFGRWMLDLTTLGFIYQLVLIFVLLDIFISLVFAVIRKKKLRELEDKYFKRETRIKGRR